MRGKGRGGEGPRSAPLSKCSGSAYEGSGGEGREGRVCLVLKSTLATPLRLLRTNFNKTANII